MTAQIGVGGMGEVYRATDTRLGRAVALKVLPSEMARDPERLLRFQREARALAALNHPHIVTIYSVEETDGIHFLTMELIEGTSLTELIPDGGLPVDRILSTGIALADALAVAHEKGIAHRDLKPANVMITIDGRLKVLDFGLAKEARATDAAAVTLTAAAQTEVGVVMGTPAYMSPEQVTGRTVDHRTDIFSLGVLLYETATGQRPFQGATSIELASAVLRNTPRPLGEIRSDAPAELTRLIDRCLEKDPDRRVQTARDVGNALREIARHAPSLRFVDEGFWIAVLPFKYAGSNADVAALADGMSEEIVIGLSRFSYLRVLTRGSTVRHARYVIEGSLRHAGATVRVAAQLVDTTSGVHLWAESFDRPFDGGQIFAVQDDLVAQIVSSVADQSGVLLRIISEDLRRKGADELTPYEAVLRVVGYGYRISAEEHAAVRTALERAVERAPTYADAWASLAVIFCEEYANGFNVGPHPLERALSAARRATEEAPESAIAYNALARTLFFRKQFPALRAAAERTAELNPLNSPSLAEMGFMIAYSGDWPRGCALVERAVRINPRHPGWYRFPLFYNAYRTADYRRALDIALRINLPRYFHNHTCLAMVYGQLGDRTAAQRAIRELLALKPDFATTARDEFGKWFERELVEHIIDGLRKAGLDIAPAA